MWVLFAALAGAPLVFVFVAFTLAQGPSAGPPLEGSADVVGILAAMSVLSAIQAVLIRRTLMRIERLTGAGVPETVDPLGLKPQSDAEKALLASVKRYQSGHIISLALSEAAALFGFVLTFLTKDIQYVVGGAALALVVDFLFLRPTPHLYKTLAREARRHG